MADVVVGTSEGRRRRGLTISSGLALSFLRAACTAARTSRLLWSAWPSSAGLASGPSFSRLCLAGPFGLADHLDQRRHLLAVAHFARATSAPTIQDELSGGYELPGDLRLLRTARPVMGRYSIARFFPRLSAPLSTASASAFEATGTPLSPVLGGSGVASWGASLAISLVSPPSCPRRADCLGSSPCPWPFASRPWPSRGFVPQGLADLGDLGVFATSSEPDQSAHAKSQQQQDGDLDADDTGRPGRLRLFFSCGGDFRLGRSSSSSSSWSSAAAAASSSSSTAVFFFRVAAILSDLEGRLLSAGFGLLSHERFLTGLAAHLFADHRVADVEFRGTMRTDNANRHDEYSRSQGVGDRRSDRPALVFLPFRVLLPSRGLFVELPLKDAEQIRKLIGPQPHRCPGGQSSPAGIAGQIETSPWSSQDREFRGRLTSFQRGISDDTPVPHNGCRPRKRRRV